MNKQHLRARAWPKGFVCARGPGPAGPMKAFTLIELLTVVAIIAVLVSILVPSLRLAKDLAVRTVCAANLHHWNIALTAYTGENQGVVPETPNPWGRYPAFILVNAGQGEAADQLSVELISPYMPGISPDNREAVDLFLCPACPEDRAQKLIRAQWDSLGIFQQRYAYFGRVDLWESAASDAEDLTGRRMEPGKLVMADVLYRWHVSGGWRYNHGRRGPSGLDTVDAHGTEWFDTGPPAITGANRLFGDGSVSWKDRGEYHPQAMDRTPSPEPHVGGGDQTFY